jgi:hypothetical protein
MHHDRNMDLVAVAALVLASTGCPVRPPDLGRGPDRPAVAPLALLDPGASSALVVRPLDLAATPLAIAVARWFRPTPEEAAQGGPAFWFGGLGHADEIAVSLPSEDVGAPVSRAVRGGDAEAQVLAQGFADRAGAGDASVVEEECADVRAFVSGDTAVAAVGADLFVAGPPETVRAACRRASGEETLSLATDPRVAPLLARLAPAAAQILYVGRVPGPLRPRLRFWGVDPLVDRIVGVSVAINAQETTVRLVADVDDEATAIAMVATATEGIEFMASRRTYEEIRLSPLIRRLAARNDGRFFYVEGTLPTPIVAAMFQLLRAVEEGTPE